MPEQTKPIEFEQVNKVLGRPESMSDSECQPLPVFSDGEYCISCWQLSDEELMEVRRTGRVWLGVLSGITQPPVFITGKSPFIEPVLPDDFDTQEETPE